MARFLAQAIKIINSYCDHDRTASCWSWWYLPGFAAAGEAAIILGFATRHW